MFEYKNFSYMLKYDFYFAINLPKNDFWQIGRKIYDP